MVKITLKPLDDGQKAVDIPVGKTTIGRGPFLGCGDKKVSRNHAILEVTEQGEVYLTPTHVNPCFYQPTADNPGTILKKDKPHKLENGDAFSLLPRAFRYQVIVTNDVTEKKIEERNEVKKDEKTNGSTEEKPKEAKIEIKEAVKEEVTKPKEIQEEKPKEIAILELSYNSEDVKQEIAKIKTEQEVNGTIAVNVKETVSKETREAKVPSQERTRRTLPVWLEELTESSKQEKKKPQPPKQQKEKQRIKRKAETQVKRKISRKNERSESDEEVEEQERERPRRSTGRSSRQNRQTRQGLSLEDFIVSDDEEWQSDKSEPKLKRRRGQRKGDDSGSDWEAEHGKKRKSRRFDSDSESGSDWGTSSRKKKLPKAKRRRSKRVAVSEEGSDEEADGDKPSKGMKGDKRIPCTYGKKCYRKNPNHVDQFSHPGDSDYNSELEPNQRNDEGGGGDDANDGKEEKPECQFGLSCYRKNPQHRKDYKHTKKVRPQREAAKQAGKKTTGLGNDDEPDSYDLNDSFLNEESDEYKPMESGSEWESGEDVERLIKEAKGFVKNKKMQKHV